MKLKVNTCDEVYYPVVSVAQPEIVESVDLIPTEPVVIVPVAMEVEKVEAIEVKFQGVEPIASVDAIREINEPKKRRRGLWRSKLGVVATTTVAIIAVILVGLRLAGFRTFTVMSGSMDPEYPVGALIYVRPVNYQDLKVGDVISYVANDEKTIVTHRIAEIEVDENDASVWRFKTKGDANSSADGKLVHYKNVLGTPMITIPVIGYIAHNIQQPPGIYIALVAGTLLLAWTFLPGTLEERRKTARKSVA